MEEEIGKWLETQGYPLEMRVAREFQAHGFRVQQSDYYQDDESGTWRETDVVAYLQATVDDLLYRVEFVVECKTAPDKPWVLFTSDSGVAAPARVVQRAASSKGRRLLKEVAKRQDIQDLSMFSVHARPAYGMTQAFGSGEDKTFRAAMSVSTAVAAKAAAADRGSRPLCVIALPVIVISGKLVEAYLDDSGEVRVESISSGTLLWRNPIVGMPHTIIRVLSEPEVPQFALEARESAGRFLELAVTEKPK